jgi:hypothetical protein
MPMPGSRSRILPVASGLSFFAALLSRVASAWIGTGECHNVSEVRDSRPSLGEDGAGVGVDLREADGAPSCSLKSKVESADA